MEGSVPSTSTALFCCVFTRLLRVGLLLCALLTECGCLTGGTQWVAVRETPRNPLTEQLKLLSKKGPEPSPRAAQVLRRYDLETPEGTHLPTAIARLMELHQTGNDREIQYTIAELAYLAAKEIEYENRPDALAYYGTSLVHAYDYLFDDRYASTLNPYDPQFRSVCDLYNQSLEGTLRLVQADGKLKPGTQGTVSTVGHECHFDIELCSSGWHDEDFDNLKFVSDYQLVGLKNHYHTYGLGVPIIAERRSHEGESGVEKFYPDKLTFPLTAFLRIDRPAAGPLGQPAPPHLVLELHDPLDRQTVAVNGTQVPLESDISTPLAYFLNQPNFNVEKVSTIGLLKPDAVEKLQGLYMMEPYDPDKMPVVLVHGLWSSPVTWMEMFNDLRSDPTIRENYQFWFYLYPTGQPFWVSATQMREDLSHMRLVIDPYHAAPALDQMVLVGHSMGGLVSKLQSVDSGSSFWATMSDHSFNELKADDELKQKMEHAFFFHPNPSVRRVVTIGTPHQGSSFANDFTQWAANKFISLPMKMVQGRQELIAENKGYFRENAPLSIRTSIDSLDPDSVLLTTLRGAEPAPWIGYHNIVGKQQATGIASWFSEEGDGVVSLASARLDGLPNVRSQLEVQADHLSVHRHPQSVLEVRRILLEQLYELQRFPFPDTDVTLASANFRVDSNEPVSQPMPPFSSPCFNELPLQTQPMEPVR